MLKNLIEKLDGLPPGDPITKLSPLYGVYRGMFYTGKELTRLSFLKQRVDPYLSEREASILQTLDLVVKTSREYKFSFLAVRKRPSLQPLKTTPFRTAVLDWIENSAFSLSAYLAITLEKSPEEMEFSSGDHIKEKLEEFWASAEREFQNKEVSWQILRPEPLANSYLAVSALADFFHLPPPPQGKYAFRDDLTVLHYLFPADIVFEKDYFTIGDRFYSIISLKEIAAPVRSDFFYALFAQTDFPFSVIMSARAAGERTFSLKANILASFTEFLVFNTKKRESIAKEQQIEQLHELRSLDYTEFFDWTIHFLVPAESYRQLKNKRNLLLNLLREKGFICYLETVGQKVVFRSLLPPYRFLPERKIVLSAQEITDLLPIHTTVSYFNSSDAMVLLDRNGKLNTLDPFSAIIINNNTAIVGASGSGKSFFTKNLIYSTIDKYGEDLRVWILDVAGEYLKLTESLGGKNVIINDKEATFSIDPFRLKDASPVLITNFLLKLLDMAVDPDDLLILVNLYLKDRPPESRSYYDFIEWQKSQEGVTQQAIALFVKKAFRFQAFLQHPNFFNIHEAKYMNFYITRDIQDEKFRQLIFFYLFFFLRQATFTISAPKLIVNDEAWKMLVEFPDGEAFLLSTIKEIRKFNGAMITIFQEFADFGQYSARAISILNNSGRVILFSQMPHALMEDIGVPTSLFEQLNLHVPSKGEERKRMIQLGQKEYSEFLVIERGAEEGNRRRRVLRLFAPPDLYRFFDTENIVQALEEYKESP